MRLTIILLIFLNSSLFAQQIKTITPNSAQPGQTLDLQITGYQTDFTQASSLIVSIFNSATLITANTVSIISKEQLLANISVPLNAAYEWSDLEVSGENISAIRKPSAFSVVNKLGQIPSISTFTPVSSVTGQSLDLTITGTNTFFTQATQINSSFFTSASSIMVNYIDVKNDSTIISNISINNNLPEGYYPFYLEFGPNNGRLYAPGRGLFVKKLDTQPKLVNITPNEIGIDTTLDLVITGLNLDFTQATNTASVSFFNGATTLFGSATSVISPLQLRTTLTVPLHPDYRGIYDVIVNTGSTNLILGAGLKIGMTSIGLKDFENEPWQFYPNPVINEFTISTELNLNNFELIDCNGKITTIRHEDIVYHTNTYNIKIGRYNLGSGLYIIQANSKNKYFKKKIFVN